MAHKQPTIIGQNTLRFNRRRMALFVRKRTAREMLKISPSKSCHQSTTAGCAVAIPQKWPLGSVAQLNAIGWSRLEPGACDVADSRALASHAHEQTRCSVCLSFSSLSPPCLPLHNKISLHHSLALSPLPLAAILCAEMRGDSLLFFLRRLCFLAV